MRESEVRQSGGKKTNGTERNGTDRKGTERSALMRIERICLDLTMHMYIQWAPDYARKITGDP
eukprot:scaffold1809_cov228-Pinguiococcus_pyrenoidosus.AAC.4